MAYPDFNPLKPDPSVDNGSDAFTATRNNMLALRDAALSGMLIGWSLTPSGGTAARPTTWTYSKGNERVRLVLTWGTAGGTAGKPTQIVVSYSADSGGTWESLGTAAITYDTAGNFTGCTGISPGLAAHWLMGLPERVRLIEVAAANYGSMAAQNANDVEISGGSIAGITDLAIADGGTGASTAAQARQNLGTHNAANITTGVMDPERLGEGIPSEDTYLRGDGTWAEVQSGTGPRPIVDKGEVATSGAETVSCDLSEADFFSMSMQSANTAGTLTIGFDNIPDTAGAYFSWHVRLYRGGRKTVAFSQSIAWAAGSGPTLSSAVGSMDLLMFYRTGNGTIRGMLVDATTV